MRKAGLAGAAYFAAIFAPGFVLGSVRVLWLAPHVGVVAAAVIEVPLMLVASAVAARYLIGRFALCRAADLVMMGAFAFALLLGAELVLGMVAFGETPQSWAAGLRTGAGAVGLAGQIAFAAMPLLISLLRKHQRRA